MTEMLLRRDEFQVMCKHEVVAVTVSIEAAMAVRRLYNDECHVIQTCDYGDAWSDFYVCWAVGKRVNE